MPPSTYELAAPNRRCARSGRELKPGEPIFSVLHDRDGLWVREDVAAEAWNGAPEDAFSFWRTSIPDEKRKGPPRLNEELLWDCFLRLEGQADPKSVTFRYVLALLLVRKKRLKLEEVRPAEDGERLTLRDAKRKQTHTVLNPGLTDAQLGEVEAEISQLME